MRLLLDTHTFFWYVTDSKRLSDTAKELINNGGNEVLLSMVSIWEVAIKQSIGKLNLGFPLREFVTRQIEQNNFDLLNIKLDYLATVSTLPLHHRDPFDRLLLAQAMVEGLPIVGADAVFDTYAIQRLW